jgi:hypothetical protein
MSESSESESDAGSATKFDEDQLKRLKEWQLVKGKEIRREADHYMLGGMEMRMYGMQAYMKKVEERVAANPPDINIVSIVDTYYSSRNPKSVSNVFRLNHISKTVGREQ